jgi:exoribonuclease-2
MGIAADFENVYQHYAEHQDRIEKYWCLRWLAQRGLPHVMQARHLKEGMSRLETIPLHLPIPELANQARMTRAKIELMDIDLLQLTAAARLVELESSPVVSEPTASDETSMGSAD